MLDNIIKFLKTLFGYVGAFFYGQARMENKNLKKKVKRYEKYLEIEKEPDLSWDSLVEWMRGQS